MSTNTDLLGVMLSLGLLDLLVLAFSLILIELPLYVLVCTIRFDIFPADVFLINFDLIEFPLWLALLHLEKRSA